MGDTHIAEALAALDDGILDLVKRALRTRTASRSGGEGIVTGNAYQSVRMRDQVLPGFRELSGTLFAGIPLKDRSFVDLGCNMGEKTRLAIAAGASFAEGIEHEEYFVRIGELINAYNRIGNISIRQGDVTRPGCLTRGYDVGACFSAFVHVNRNLEEVLSRISELFILETHQLDDGWYGHYVARVAPLMPHWALYGFSDHRRSHGAAKRAHIAFGRDRGTVAQVPLGRAEALPADDAGLVSLDVRRSPRAGGMWGQSGEGRRFFTSLREALRSLRPAGEVAISALLNDAIPALGELCEAQGHTRKHFATDLYWLEFLRGVACYVADGGLRPTNPYVGFMRELSAAGSYDPDMAFFLGDEGRALTRLAPRLEAFLSVLRDRRLRAPLVVYNPLELELLEARGYVPCGRMRREHIVTTAGTGYRLQLMDGNHRLAGLWLGGAETCPAMFVWTNLHGLDRGSYALFDSDERQDSLVVPLIGQSVLRLRRDAGKAPKAV